MQTGTRRRRSDSSASDSSTHRNSGSSKRPRASSPISTATHPPAGPSSTPAVPAAIPTADMTQPTNGNGAAAHQPIAGPSGNGSQRVQLQGSLMYPDDSDWRAADDEDEAMDVDGVVKSGESSSKRLPELTGTKRIPVDREEVTRVMLQALRDIGYHQSADLLESESGYVLASQAGADFQSAILGGRWSEALALLPALGITLPTPPEAVVSSASSIASGKSKAVAATGKDTPADCIRFLVSQQKYLEMIEMGAQKKALAVLRNELAPVAQDPDVLHHMSGYMMCMDREDLYERAQWDGAAGTSRRRLLEQIQPYISPKLLLPPRRLATLLEQARLHQQESCFFHNDPTPSSLYTDHECATTSFPSATSHILVDHGDEVHNLAWSRDGTMLATAGHDKMVVIWRLIPLTRPSGEAGWDIVPVHQLKDHRESVGALAWSPDGSILVTSADRGLYMWNTEDGTLKNSPTSPLQHTDEISAIRWMPDGTQFLVSTMDCKLTFYSARGDMKRQWNTPTMQIRDFDITPDGLRLVCAVAHIRRHLDDPKPKPSIMGRPIHDPINGINSEHIKDFGYEEMDNGVVVILLAEKRIESALPVLGCGISSLSMASDGKRFLVNVEDENVRLYSLNDTHLKLERKFEGHVHSRYVIRSCFGPPKNRYVLSGSEDGHVYVWDATTGKSLHVLHGHSDSVNAVAWNPIASRKLFASCSDDHQVRIWQPSTLNVGDGVQVGTKEMGEEGEGLEL